MYLVDRVLTTPATIVAPPGGVIVSTTQVVAKKPGLAVVPVPPTGAVHYRTGERNITLLSPV